MTFDTLIAAFKKGNTAEQIQASFPSLSLSQIYGAIAWYLDHQAEAEEYLKERQAELMRSARRSKANLTTPSSERRSASDAPN